MEELTYDMGGLTIRKSREREEKENRKDLILINS